MFIVSITYKAELAEVDFWILDHQVFLDKYYASGHFLASGKKEPRTGGVILVNAEKPPFFKITKMSNNNLWIYISLDCEMSLLCSKPAKHACKA